MRKHLSCEQTQENLYCCSNEIFILNAAAWSERKSGSGNLYRHRRLIRLTILSGHVCLMLHTVKVLSDALLHCQIFHLKECKFIPSRRRKFSSLSLFSAPKVPRDIFIISLQRQRGYREKNLERGRKIGGKNLIYGFISARFMVRLRLNWGQETSGNGETLKRANYKSWTSIFIGFGAHAFTSVHCKTAKIIQIDMNINPQPNMGRFW